VNDPLVEPKIGDMVKHRTHDVIGFVVDKQPNILNPSIIYLKVRARKTNVVYVTPMDYWCVWR